MDPTKIILEKRDVKAKPHLEQYAPVWLVEQKMIPEDEAMLFEVIFQHNLYGWVKRRYRFDGFNNVLYYRGQVTLSEEDTLQVIGSKEPYIAALVADIPNAYGG